MSAPLFCPECRSEFLPTASECGDCRAALVSESTLADIPADVMPPIGELVCIRAASVGWAQGLSGRLADAGISHRIEMTHSEEDEGSVRQPGANLPYGVYVRADDVEAATAIDAQFTEYQIPDLPDLEEHEAAGDACPACGAAISAETAECPDCGIVLQVEA